MGPRSFICKTLLFEKYSRGGISSSAKTQPWGFNLYREDSAMRQLKELSMDFIFSEGIVNYTIQRGR